MTNNLETETDGGATKRNSPQSETRTEEHSAVGRPETEGRGRETDQQTREKHSARRVQKEDEPFRAQHPEEY